MGGSRITVNDKEYNLDVEARTHLADFLREDLRLTGTHLACEHGICGACTVLIDGKTARSCLTLAIACDGRNIRTIEGFKDDKIMNSLRDNFNREHALQCGFCTPGMLITARDLVLRSEGINEEQVRVEMSGNLCRCTGYRGIIRAILNVLSDQAEGDLEISPAALGTNSAAKSVFLPFKPFRSEDLNVPNYSSISAIGNEKNSKITEEIIINHKFSRVWKVFNDIPTVVDCLPGASLIEYQEDILKGKVTTKLGPIRVEFIGTAFLQADDTTNIGVISGNGTDNLSGTRAKGEITYQLFDKGNDITRVVLSINYNLQGPLSQFSRDGLVSDFVRNIIKEFSQNLDLVLGNKILHPNLLNSRKHISLGKLLWDVLVKFIKSKL